jgi:hypothetical protein
MKRFFAFVLSVAINAAALGSLHSIASEDAPEGQVYITELGAVAAPTQVAALSAR